MIRDQEREVMGFDREMSQTHCTARSFRGSGTALSDGTTLRGWVEAWRAGGGEHG
jgi:hypothetical protein